MLQAVAMSRDNEARCWSAWSMLVVEREVGDTSERKKVIGDDGKGVHHELRTGGNDLATNPATSKCAVLRTLRTV